MPTPSWKQLLTGAPLFRGEGKHAIAAYSEFMPPPWLGCKPYGDLDAQLAVADDLCGWPVTEYEEAFELRPGLAKLAQDIVHSLEHLGNGRAAHGIARAKLIGNPYWPPELAEQAGSLRHERYVVLLPLALSRTQDDKGRVRWTLFGGSEQGPAKAFWKSFFVAPKRQLPAGQALAFLRRLLAAAYGEAEENLADLHRAGFRVLPRDDEPAFSYWGEGSLPGWSKPYVWAKGQSVRAVKYLLTFRPFGELPAPVRRAYLAGELHLLPFPGSLVFWGAQSYFKLQQQLPLAMQIPLLHLMHRCEGWRGLRVPQSGWLHEPRPGKAGPDDQHGPLRNTYKRTHRWQRVLRHDDELALSDEEDKLVHVLFSAMPNDVGLYGKPMARNAQVWTHDYQLLLDGPRASHGDLEQALRTVNQGGLFGYRFQFPAMRVGQHEVYWHRPLVAYLSPQTGEPAVLPDAPPGYLTAYPAAQPDLARPVELWPRLLQREAHVAAVELFEHGHDHHGSVTCLNVRKLLDTRHLLLGDGLLPRSVARQLLTAAKTVTLEGWLEALPEQASDSDRGDRLADNLRNGLEPEPAPLPEALTLEHTGRRSFEIAYWKTIALLAEGTYLTKNNADCIRDPITQKHLSHHHHRDLDALGNYLLTHYTRAVAAAGMTGKALVGDLPFSWCTDFSFPWMGGWLNNQQGHAQERDLVVVIPGRDRTRAVIMADHYDTAYMADHYDPHYGGDGSRLAAAGADDNHSATVAMMLAAPLFLEMSKARRLGCDIWLVHLTGEEFPADCLGARHLCQRLVEGNLAIRLPGGKEHDLSRTRVQGVYVMDMIAHNNDHDRDVFQIAPGTGRSSLWLAYQAHLAAEVWNASTRVWNQRSSRRGCGRGHRSPQGDQVPATARHLALHGELRPPYDPRSTLYNTDGQVFSDAGVPVVLFMENYDINREGYHDSHDTMANIDLDYGVAVAAIAMESVARAATEEPPAQTT